MLRRLKLAYFQLVLATGTTVLVTGCLGGPGVKLSSPAPAATPTPTPAPSAVQITTTSLPAGGLNLTYSTTVAATGGTPPYAWSAPGLPNGLSIDPVTGVISGTPTATGNSNVDVMVHDAGNPEQSASASLNLAVLSRGVIAVISEDSSGNLSKGVVDVVGTLQNVVLSEHGRYAAFTTKPAGLISPEANFAEVYWHDSCVGASNCTPKTLLASATNSNTGGGVPQEGNGLSFEPTISADGQFVGFISQATNLDPKVYPIKLQHVYIRNTCLGGAAANCTPFTGLADVSVDASAELNSSIQAGQYDMDAGADHVAFTTDATNVLSTVPIAGLTYLEDTACTVKLTSVICTPQLTVLSVDQSRNLINPVLDEQGLLLAGNNFVPIAGSSLVSLAVIGSGTCIDGADQVSCLGSGAPAQMVISVDGAGAIHRNDATIPSISAPGRYVVFQDQDALAPHSMQYSASDLNTNIYLRDTCQEAAGLQATSVAKVCGTLSTTTISVANDLTPANGLSSVSNHAISADGRFVIFTSRASNLTPGSTPSGVFIRDTCNHAAPSCQPSTILVSLDSSGANVQPVEGTAVISADGHFCAFEAFFPASLTINGRPSVQYVLALTGF